MYIEIVPNRTSPPALVLRESFRDGGQIRKRTLANLSHWEPARVEALRRALRGDFDHLTGGAPICGPVFGVLYALKHVAADLGLPRVLGRTRTGKLSLFLTLAQVAHQGARLAAVRWGQSASERARGGPHADGQTEPVFDASPGGAPGLAPVGGALGPAACGARGLGCEQV